MPAPVEIDSTVMLTVVGDLCGQTTMNTFPYQVIQITGAAPNQQPAFIAFYNALRAGGRLLADYQAAMPPNWTHRQSWFQQIRSVRYRKVVITENWSGTFNDEDAVTANVQASITRFGSLANRHEVGGIRVPAGTGTTYHINGLLGVDYKAALSDVADEMSRDVTALAVIYRPLVGLNKPPYPLTWCEGAFVQDTTRVIRRRTVGLGI